MKMQIKNIHPLNLFYFQVKTTVNQLDKYVAVVAHELMKEAADHNIQVTGPVYWIYLGFDGNEKTEFALEIAVPVSKISDTYTGRFSFKRPQPFKALTTRHEGNWYKIPETYQKLFDYIGQNNLVPVGENRELYINMDFENPDANETEIQIGVQ